MIFTFTGEPYGRHFEIQETGAEETGSYHLRMRNNVARDQERDDAAAEVNFQVNMIMCYVYVKQKTENFITCSFNILTYNLYSATDIFGLIDA